MKSFIRSLVIAFAVVVPALAPAFAEAATSGATLSLAPSTGSYGQGETLSVDVYEDSASEPVNAANIVLGFQTSQLEFVNVDSSSAFGVVGKSTSSGGNVNIERGALPAVTGRQLIATVRFKVKALSGSSTINFASGSVIVSSKTNKPISTSNTSATYTLKAAGSGANAAADKIAPTLKNTKVSAVTASSATINWETSEPATTEVAYGLDKNYGLSAGTQDLVTVHKVVLSTAALRPGTVYHYSIKSVDAAGNAVSSKDATFTTKGVSAKITVIDENKKTLSGATVQIGSSKGETDSSGNVTLDDLKVGKTNATVTYKGNKSSESVTIKGPDSNGDIQKLTLQVSSKADTTPFLIIGALVILLLGGFLYARRNKGSGGGDNPVVPVSGLDSPQVDNKPSAEASTNSEKPAADSTPIDIKSDTPPNPEEK